MLPYSGNPVAVVFDADNLSTAQMQDIARWMNLSETVFLQQPSEPTAVRLNDLVRDMEKLLRRVLHADIEFDTGVSAKIIVYDRYFMAAVREIHGGRPAEIAITGL